MLDNVTILGCGRTAQAMCAYLSVQGAMVTMWGRDPSAVSKLADQGITVTGCCAGVYHPTVTTRFDDALCTAKWLFVMTTSDGHLPVAKRLHGLLRSKQRILIFNGNWGAYEFCAELGEELQEKEIVVAETCAMIFLADYQEGHLHIKRIKENIGVAAVPADACVNLLAELADNFTQFVPERNIACTSINNSNPVIHAPISLFNITRLENAEDFLFYATAATRSVVDFIEAIDAERCAVAQTIGADPMTCLEIINSFWPQKYDNLYDALKCNTAYQTGIGPKSLQHRYINEDIPYGMAPISALGQQYGVPTPYIDALLICYKGLLGNRLGSSPDFSRVELQSLC